MSELDEAWAAALSEAERKARLAGLLPESDPTKMNFGGDARKAWKDIWGCGQGIGAVKEVVPARVLVARLAAEYEEARHRVL